MNKQARTNTICAATNTLYNLGLELYVERSDARRQELMVQIGDLCMRTGDKVREHLMDWSSADE